MKMMVLTYIKMTIINMYEVVNNFFSGNYEYLKMISEKYLRRFNYRDYQSDELLSDYYIHILENPRRTDTYERVIREGNGLRYMIQCIKTTIYNHKKFIDEQPKKKIKFYTDYVIDDPEDLLEESLDRNCLADILITAEEIKNELNYYDYDVWVDYYFTTGMTYKQMEKKYKLSTFPIREMVVYYNDLIKDKLRNEN